MKKSEKTSQKMREWIKTQRFTHKTMSENLGITVQTMRNLIGGAFIPGLKLAVLIELLTKGEIKARDWIDSEDVKFDVRYVSENSIDCKDKKN